MRREGGRGWGSLPRAFIALGSNLDPERHIPAALRLLAERVRLVAVSTFYTSRALPPPQEGPDDLRSHSDREESGPLDRPEQPDFYNGAVEIDTDLPPHELKYAVLREIEAALGRRRGADKYAAREIDLDLIWYDNLVVNEPDLILPDPEIAARPFLAVPLAELAPDLFPAATAPADLRPLTGFTARLRKELLDEPREGTEAHP